MGVPESLGRATHRASLDAVGRVLEKDPERDSRIAALRVLALSADHRAVRYLRAVLQGVDEDIRTAAAQMLAKFDRRAHARKGAKE